MRLALPARLMVWTLIGAFLVAISLTVLSRANDSTYCLILFAFAFWSAAGVDTLLRIEPIWNARWRRFSSAVVFGLPLVVLLAASSQMAGGTHGQAAHTYNPANGAMMMGVVLGAADPATGSTLTAMAPVEAASMGPGSR